MLSSWCIILLSENIRFSSRINLDFFFFFRVQKSRYCSTGKSNEKQETPSPRTIVMLRNLIQITLLVGKSTEQTARIRIFQFAVHGIQTAEKRRKIAGKDEIVEIGWSKSVSSRKVGGRMPEVGMGKVSNRGARYFKVSRRDSVEERRRQRKWRVSSFVEPGRHSCSR